MEVPAVGKSPRTSNSEVGSSTFLPDLERGQGDYSLTISEAQPMGKSPASISGVGSSTTSSTSDPDAAEGQGAFSLTIEALEPQKRRWEVWLGFAVATAAAEVVCYFLSGNTCGVEEWGVGTRPGVDRRFTTKEQVFFEWQPFLLVGPWASAALLACLVDHRGRFCPTSPLHIWARRFALVSMANAFPRLLAIPLYCAGEENIRYAGHAILNVSVLTWAAMQLIAFWVVVLKLRALRQMSIAKICRWGLAADFLLALATSLCYFVAAFRVSPEDAPWQSPQLMALKCAVLLVLFGSVTVASWGMLRAASRAEHASPLANAHGSARDASRSQRVGGVTSHETTTSGLRHVMQWTKTNETTTSRLRHAIQWTRTTAVISMASGALSSVYLGIWFFQAMVNTTGLGWLQIADHFVNCAQMAFLSGIVGPDPLQSSPESLTRVGRHSGFALQDAKRIAFTGFVGAGSSRCVVSFPGVYADLWARVTDLQFRQASVACVFLTDTSTGLGEHAADPDNPHHACYCQTIYPRFSADAYLRTLQRPSPGADMQEYRRQLAFEKVDAEAMGVHLFIENDYPSSLRGWARRMARRRACQLCENNNGRAPWGCMWFAKWVKNAEKAAELGQDLMVFYKEGKVGAGKLPWEHLCDSESVALASGCSGLGASQRVEVSFLERKGFKYTELDVLDFENEFPEQP